MSTAAISAIVSTFVTVVVGTVIQWGEQTIAWFRKRVRPDHIPIGSGGGYSATQAASATDQVRVVVCCAPNRSLRQPTIDPDRAIALIHHRFREFVTDEPVFSMPEYGVRFEGGHGGPQVYAWAHTQGRVDLSLHVPTTPSKPGPITISVLDVIKPILRVLGAVRSDEYKATFDRRQLGFRHRFDWAIAVSPIVVVQDTGMMSWQELTFPGATPRRAGTSQQAHCPSSGYAYSALQNWDVRRDDEELVRVFLRDFLYQNGFHNIEAAVDDTVTALGLSSRHSSDRRVDIAA